MIEFFCFLFGAVTFSFAGVCIDRIPRGEDIVHGRSHCDSCGTDIKPYDLIPVVSYILLKGRCRNCKAKIPVYCLILEILGGILAVLSYRLNGLTVNTAISFLICFVLVVIAFIDQFTTDIYTSTIIALGIFCLIYRMINGIDIVDLLLSMFVISGFMFVVSLVIKGAFGFGDVELMFMTGLFLSFKEMLLAFFIGVITAGITGIIMLSRKQKEGSDHIAFGPFLVIGILIAYFFGNSIISWYFGLFI
ncbi:MAG: prepilin peptidase [Erysipelotrichaceae bacterium]